MRGPRACPRVLPSAGNRDEIPGMETRRHLVPKRRMTSGCERQGSEGSREGGRESEAEAASEEGKALPSRPLSV